MKGYRIVADRNIPHVEEAFGQFGTVHTLPGREIRRPVVQEADALLVRSVTSVGSHLLEGSDVQFVGSATVGTDHVDDAYLEQRGICFTHAPGSNADSVADYVVVALLHLAHQRGVSLSERTVGIVGCGNIGGRLAGRLPALGMSVLCNDPPRAEAAEAEGFHHEFVELDTVLTEANVVTLHVPLKSEGPHRTDHLVDASFLDRLKSGSWLLNTSRGSVVDGDAVRKARSRGDLDALVLDVWENEPSPDPNLIRTVDVATPHVAGYAYEGKIRATAMLYRKFCSYLDVEPNWDISDGIQFPSRERFCTPPDPRLPAEDWLYRLARQAYNLRRDDAAMRTIVELDSADRKEAFSRLRDEYHRHELQQHAVSRVAIPSHYARSVAYGLTIQMN